MNNRAQFIFEYLNYPIYWSNNKIQFYVKRIEIYLCSVHGDAGRAGCAEWTKEDEDRKISTNADAHWIFSVNAVQKLRRLSRKWHHDKCKSNQREEHEIKSRKLSFLTLPICDEKRRCRRRCWVSHRASNRKKWANKWHINYEQITKYMD